MNTKKTHPSSDPLQAAPNAPAQRRGMLSARALWALLAVLALVLVAGLVFLAGKQAARPQKTITLKESQAGSQALLRAGDTLEVNLEGNPTTGYTWSAAGFDAAILKPLGEPEFHPASSALGAGGTVTYRFEAAGAGQTTLTMIYSRPFEKGVPPLKTFMVNVSVSQ